MKSSNTKMARFKLGGTCASQPVHQVAYDLRGERGWDVCLTLEIIHDHLGKKPQSPAELYDVTCDKDMLKLEGAVCCVIGSHKFTL